MSKKKNKHAHSQHLVTVSSRDLSRLAGVSIAGIASGVLALVLAGTALSSLDTGNGLQWLRLFAPTATFADIIMVFIGAFLMIAFGFLGYRAFREPSKIVPFHWISLFAIAFMAVDFVTRLAGGISWLNLLCLVIAIVGYAIDARLKKQLTSK